MYHADTLPPKNSVIKSKEALKKVLEGVHTYTNILFYFPKK